MVLQQEVIISHAGNVIAHHTVQGFRAALRDVEGWKTPGVLEVVTEEALHTPHNDLALRPNSTMGIEFRIQELLQFLVVAGSPRA